MRSFAVLHASQLVTLAGPKRPRVGREMSELAILPDGGMLIRDGKVNSVGTTNQIKESVADAEIVDAGGRVVLPGFVDAHTHLIFAGNRLSRRRHLVNRGKNSRSQQRRASRASKETCGLVSALRHDYRRS